ncbi:MarR family transcriptional regulator [Halosolutus amylolyticus]|uniref:MarR family transcriptional regulator n=1 Tax=Halosolutus amylolyticus TaxID=2932267 RepID=A0ABD5PMX1_9EURY|nr:MarR family transcriptional regulator [Halosolutus amylolyticus]
MSTSEHESDLEGDTPAPSIGELPPSSKLVYKVLEYEGQLTQDEIARESRLCARTVRYALGKLEGADLVASRVCLNDARKSTYWIEE